MSDEAYEKFGYDVGAAFSYNGHGHLLPDLEAKEAEWTDGADEAEWAWLFRLKDGRYIAATGGHDYTGWDCQSSLTVSVHATREEAIRFGFDANMREMLGLSLPEDERAPPEDAADE